MPSDGPPAGKGRFDQRVARQVGDAGVELRRAKLRRQGLDLGVLATLITAKVCYAFDGVCLCSFADQDRNFNHESHEFPLIFLYS
jgi:hypothetical protein